MPDGAPYPPDLDATVVVCARNAAATLAEQMAGLADQDFAGTWEVVLSDNGSADDSVAVARRARPPGVTLVVVDSGDRVGLAHARNVGALAARGRVIAFCDADDIVDRGWLSALIRALEGRGIVGARLEVDQLNSDDAIRARGPLPADSLPVALGYLPHVIGAGFAVRRDLFHAVGGFDEAFERCCDDVDFSWRLQLAGNSIGYASDAVVHYRLREDVRALARQQFAYGKAENRLREKFGRHVVPRPPLGDQLWPWWFLVSRLDHLVRGRALRGAWIREASYRAGRLWGRLLRTGRQ